MSIDFLFKWHVWIERLWQKPESGGLVHAQCMRMGKETTLTMNQSARQEALTFMMDQLLNNLLRGREGELESESSSGSSGESEFL